jgi:prepilin-type N-terminal cleavage/methylation domain-containing protein
MNRKQDLPAGRRGFTLLELLVVVAVIIILALLAILVINPKTSINRAYDAVRKKDLATLKIAFENYYSDYSCYPTQEQISNCDSEDLDPYIKLIPCDPSINAPYELIAEPTICPQNFMLFSLFKQSQSTSTESANPNCLSVNSPNTPADPEHDCTEYFSAYMAPSGSGGSGSGDGGGSSPSTTPTPPPMPIYYCSGLDNCTQFPVGKSCSPSFPWPDTSCSGACSDPENICTPR